MKIKLENCNNWKDSRELEAFFLCKGSPFLIKNDIMKDYYVICVMFFGIYPEIEADDLTLEEAEKLVFNLSDGDVYTWYEKHNKKEDPKKYNELLTHKANKKYKK